MAHTQFELHLPAPSGDVKIYVSVGNGVLPVVYDNRKKEHPDATASCND